MKTRLVLCLLALALVLPCLAQTTLEQPQYLLGAGAGFNSAASPRTNGWMTFGAKVTQNNYSLTTLEMTGKRSSLRTGVARVLLEKDRFALIALGDAGVQAGSENAGGAFSGGGSLLYDISRWVKTSNAYAVATVRVLKTSLEDVQPVFSFGFVKTF